MRLAAGDWAMEIAPEIGGAILRLAHAGEAVLRSTPQTAIRTGDVGWTGCFPLIPYANRIANGRFRFDGVEHHLRVGFPGAPHALHGVGWRRAWTVAEADGRSARLTLSHRPVGDAAGDWPFAFDAAQRFALDEAGLEVALALRNAADRPAPAGIGLHPFFPRPPGLTLTARAEGAWLNAGDMLPSVRSRDARFDFASPAAPIDGVDNDLFGWDGRAVLTRADGRRTLIEAESLFRHLRVFTPAGEAFLAVEPVSHMADAISRMDEPDHGLAVLAPGETLQGQVRFRVQTSV
ncbi:MAG TPA: aldose 1-epimerase [Caulobacteraceae bacterium]|nr:aldose 1-epimerase [Caulobacteraceae bacterium]